MQCEIINGELQVKPQPGTEAYAVKKWEEEGHKIAGVKIAASAAATTNDGKAGATVNDPPASAEDAEREQIKAELTRLGVKFKPQTRTPTLRVMLENATGGNEQDKADIERMKASNGKPAEAATEAEDDMFALPGDNAPAKAYTVEDIRDTLMKVAADKTKGAPVARELLKKFGAKNISEVKESDYAELMKAAGAE